MHKISIEHIFLILKAGSRISWLLLLLLIFIGFEYSLAGERESNGNSQLQGFPWFTFCCIKNNVPKRKDGGKKTNKTNKTAQTKNREGLISFMTRVMIGGCKADVQGEEGTCIYNNALDHPFEQSTVVLDSRCQCGLNYSS